MENLKIDYLGLKFTSYKEMQDFLKLELESFSPIYDAVARVNQTWIGNSKNRILSVINQLESVMGVSLVQEPTAAQLAPLNSKILELNNVAEKILWSQLPVGTFALEVKEQYGASIAMYAVQYALNIYTENGIAFNNPDALTGLFLGFQFKNIITDLGAKKLKSELHTLAKKSNDIFSSLKNSYLEEEKANLEYKNNHTAILQKMNDDYENQFESFKNDYTISLEKLEEDKINLLAAIRTDIGLKEPVKYWEDLRSRSNKSMKVLFGTSAAIMIIGFILVDIVFNKFKHTGLEIHKPGFVLPLVVLLVFVWISRICLKIAVNNMNIANVCEEKIAMTKSYIALLSENHLKETEEKQIVLESIFKLTTPSMDGDVQPHPAMEVINNFKK